MNADGTFSSFAELTQEVALIMPIVEAMALSEDEPLELANYIITQTRKIHPNDDICRCVLSELAVAYVVWTARYKVDMAMRAEASESGPEAGYL